MKSSRQKLIKSSFEALASLETAMKATTKVNLSNSDRIIKNMAEICSLIEEMIDASEEEFEKKWDEWENSFQDKADILIGQYVMAEQELKRKK